jgi:ABC-2 type transport system permease protein
VSPAPSFVRHLQLLWGLRLTLAFNRAGTQSGWLGFLAKAASAAPALATGGAAWRLMLVPAIAESEVWPEFVLRMVCFVTSAVWVLWPVLSAGVDDHTEATRYASFPITSARLLLASAVASLFEPRALVFTGPIVGAFVGYLMTHEVPWWPLLLPLFAVYMFFNAALARVGMHAVLLLLRQQRSAELLGGGFFLFLLGAAFIPPVDTAWLIDIGSAGVAAVPDSLMADATLALGRFPTGWFAHAVRAAAVGRLDWAFRDGLHLLELTALAFVVAWGLLVDFHRHAPRGGATSARARQANLLARAGSPFAALVVKEAVDLWNNPRARLLVSVPFVLGILLKLISGRALFVYLLGPAADAWVLMGLCVYGAIVMGATFSQNAFGYDGHGFVAYLSAPLPLASVLRAKNVVHTSAAVWLAALVAIFYSVYFRTASALDVGVAMGGALALVPVLLAMGNVLSLYFPVKFHANLKRRDAVPFLASMLGVAAASLGTGPTVWALRFTANRGTTWLTLGLVAGWAVVSLAVYWLTWPWAARRLEMRRELIARAVTRD